MTTVKHLSLVGGTDVQRPATPSAAPAPRPQPIHPGKPFGTPEEQQARALVLAAHLPDGRPVRAVLEAMRQAVDPQYGLADYADTLLTLKRVGVHAYLPDAAVPALFARVDDPQLLLKALNLREQLKPAQVKELQLLDEYRTWMSEVQW